MSHPLTVELSDATYAALQLRAEAAAQSPAAAAAAALEQYFNAPDGMSVSGHPTTEAEKKAARERFERHFGKVNRTRPADHVIDGGCRLEARPPPWEKPHAGNPVCSSRSSPQPCPSGSLATTFATF